MCKISKLFALITAFWAVFLSFPGCGSFHRPGGREVLKSGANGQQALLQPEMAENGITPLDIDHISKNEIEVLPLLPIDETLSEESGASQDREESGSGIQGQKDAYISIQSKFDKALEFYQDSQDFWQKGDIDNALASLDNAYALIVNTPILDSPKYTQQKDDLRYMISKRILEIYASRYTTVKGNHNAIPLSINSHVQKEIDFFTKSGPGRSFFIESFKRSGRYRPYILSKLRGAGLPEELSWLPLIESGYKVKAMSNARALGLWQFIASTGYKFGLKRDRYIDERLDPFKSTEAAIAYLKELHDIFGDWLTVLAAYNCGEGRVLSVIRNQNINYLDNFWDLYQQLPNETARYVPKFLAVLHIINHLSDYGFDGIEPDPPLSFEIVEIKKQASLKKIAQAMGLDEQTLVMLNPELRYKILPNRTYPLRVPTGKKEILLAKIDEIEEYYQSPHNIIYHRVRPGETLSTIARRYNTTPAKIAWYNNIYRQNYIVAGQVLKIPQAGAFAAQASMIAPPPRLVIHTVKQGDSLWLLAKRYNTTTKEIQKINGLKSVMLHIGQKLKIPVGGSRNFSTYTVRPGDSPFSIAKKYNMKVDRLLKINRLKKNSTIYPGQVLYVE